MADRNQSFTEEEEEYPFGECVVVLPVIAYFAPIFTVLLMSCCTKYRYCERNFMLSATVALCWWMYWGTGALCLIGKQSDKNGILTLIWIGMGFVFWVLTLLLQWCYGDNRAYIEDLKDTRPEQTLQKHLESLKTTCPVVKFTFVASHMANQGDDPYEDVSARLDQVIRLRIFSLIFFSYFSLRQLRIQGGSQGGHAPPCPC